MSELKGMSPEEVRGWIEKQYEKFKRKSDCGDLEGASLVAFEAVFHLFPYALHCTDALEKYKDLYIQQLEIIGEWQDATGLELGGDPGGVEPKHLRRYMEKQDAELEARDAEIAELNRKYNALWSVICDGCGSAANRVIGAIEEAPNE